ncbi:MAG: hypothetical protein JWM44_976 [Bacilli bacterium]|nr:hypothetical protein [Bacilli bacterium]
MEKEIQEADKDKNLKEESNKDEIQLDEEPEENPPYYMDVF